MAWFGLQVLLGDADNPVDNLKGIFHLPTMLKLFFLAVPATGILMALVGWLPVPKEVRGIAQLGSGLLLIALLILGDSKGEGIAQAMLGGGWIRYIMFISAC